MLFTVLFEFNWISGLNRRELTSLTLIHIYANEIVVDTINDMLIPHFLSDYYCCSKGNWRLWVDTISNTTIKMLILIWPAIRRLLWVFSVYYHITDVWYLFLGSTVWNTGGDRRHQGIFPILNIIWTSFSAGFHNALSLVKRASLNSSFIRDFVINVCRI